LRRICRNHGLDRGATSLHKAKVEWNLFVIISARSACAAAIVTLWPPLWRIKCGSVRPQPPAGHVHAALIPHDAFIQTHATMQMPANFDAFFVCKSAFQCHNQDGLGECKLVLSSRCLLLLNPVITSRSQVANSFSNSWDWYSRL